MTRPEPAHDPAKPRPAALPTSESEPAYAEATVLDWPLGLLVVGVVLSVVVGVVTRPSTGGFLLGAVLLVCGGARLVHRGRRPQAIATRSWGTDVITTWALGIALFVLSYLLRHYLGG